MSPHDDSRVLRSCVGVTLALRPSSTIFPTTPSLFGLVMYSPETSAPWSHTVEVVITYAPGAPPIRQVENYNSGGYLRLAISEVMRVNLI